MEKFYIVYKTTNLLNGKFYIGSHQTFNLQDGYYGSGKVLRLAIKKYGKDNFLNEVICRCSSLNVARCVEGHLVRFNINKFGRKCYNRSYSGTGAVLGEGNAFYGKTHSKESRNKISDSAKLRVGDKNHFYGKKHSKETIDKIKSNRPNTNNCLNMLVAFIKKSKRWYCTPEGCFYSDRYAEEITGLNRNSIKSRCLFPDKLVKPNYQIPEIFWNKTWRENGYYYVDKATGEE